MNQVSYNKNKILVIGLTVFLMVIVIGGVMSALAQRSFFEKSLHYTGEGMRYCYERGDGFMGITKIPYEKLDCKNCHVQSCDTCHAQQKGEGYFYTKTKAKDINTCLGCHGRQGITIDLGKKMGKLDVHLAKGMVCTDCHKGEDVHGDGKFYKSMREPNAVKVSCTKCHIAKKRIESHTVHGDKLACAACHVYNTIACMNCHFDACLKTGSRKGNFFPMQSWLLLINHEGKVTSGTAMSLVSKNKKFIVYAPYYTHAIQKKGRRCGDCHANEAMKLIQQGKPVPMMVFKDNAVEGWMGVAPAVHEKLSWVYLDKEGDTWIPIKGEKPEKVQWWYAEPLTQQQLESLFESYE